jgi:hypothetical protein
MNTPIEPNTITDVKVSDVVMSGTGVTAVFNTLESNVEVGRDTLHSIQEPLEPKKRKARQTASTLLPLDIPDLSFLELRPERETRNGIMRPEERTTTGIVWDIAQALMQYRAFKEYTHTIPLIHEVKAAYLKLPGANEGTCSTQYHGWLTFHGYRAEVDARRAFDDQTVANSKQMEAAAKAQKLLEKRAIAAEKVAKKAAQTLSTSPTERTRAPRKMRVTVAPITPQDADLSLMHEEDLHALTLHTPPKLSYEELVRLVQDAVNVKV